MSRWTLPLLVLALAAQTASACSVPVFRYALEHWRADPFMVVVFHRGELTDEQVALLETLESLGPNGLPTANVMVKAVDVDHEADPSLRRLWELQETDTLPWMAVHAPVKSGPPQRIWGGEFRAETATRLLQSPARREIAERLVTGDAVVWVYVETGDAAIDDAAFRLLEAQLAHLQTTLRLPEIEEADFGELSVVPESLRLAFSALRVARDDAEESQFLNMLLHAGPQPAAEQSPPLPMAFPIFGRGRAFDALVGEDLTKQTIEDACRFLTGACQCTVKTQNPGVDLLMSVDWDRLIKLSPIEDGTPPTLVGLQNFAPGDNPPQTDVADDATNPSSPDVTPEPSSNPDTDTLRVPAMDNGTTNSDVPVTELTGFDSSLARLLLVTVGLLAVAVIVATLFLTIRSK